MKYRQPTYEEVELGEVIEKTVEADEHYVKGLVFALDDDTPWYASDQSPFGGRVVPSAGIAKDLVALFLVRYDPAKVVGLHQKEEIFFHKPARLGARLTLRGSYTDKYMKRGKGYTVFDTEARDENGDLIVRQISTEIMRIPDKVVLGSGEAKPDAKDAVNPSWPKDRKPIARATAGMAPGTPVVPLVKTAHQDQMSVFSGCNNQWHNIHTEIAVAKKAGFPDTLAQGMQTSCWTSQMLCDFFGPDWLTSGWLKMIYLQPVFRGDTITCRAVVKGSEKTEGGTRLNLEVWVEKSDGTVTSVGWASALMT